MEMLCTIVHVKLGLETMCRGHQSNYHAVKDKDLKHQTSLYRLSGPVEVICLMQKFHNLSV